jgi:hypothetical protein
MLVDSLRIGTTKVPKDGTDLRMPAAFFIGPDLKIFDLHYGRDAGDHLTPEMMDRWLRVVQGDRRQPVAPPASSSG